VWAGGRRGRERWRGWGWVWRPVAGHSLHAEHVEPAAPAPDRVAPVDAVGSSVHVVRRALEHPIGPADGARRNVVSWCAALLAGEGSGGRGVGGGQEAWALALDVTWAVACPASGCHGAAPVCEDILTWGGLPCRCRAQAHLGGGQYLACGELALAMRKTPVSTFVVDDVDRAAPSHADETPLVGSTSLRLLLIGGGQAPPGVTLLGDLVVDDGVAHWREGCAVSSRQAHGLGSRLPRRAQDAVEGRSGRGWRRFLVVRRRIHLCRRGGRRHKCPWSWWR
jgi:hypothetical protein